MACLGIKGKEDLVLTSEYNPSAGTQQSTDIRRRIAIFPLHFTGHRIQGANGPLGAGICKKLIGST
jgi:hypothetical protein